MSLFQSELAFNGRLKAFAKFRRAMHGQGGLLSIHENFQMRALAGLKSGTLLLQPLLHLFRVHCRIINTSVAFVEKITINFCMSCCCALCNRSRLVALNNLVDLIVTCLTHPAAANPTFLVSDGEDVSITELLRRMGGAMGRPARLVPVSL